MEQVTQPQQGQRWVVRLRQGIRGLLSDLRQWLRYLYFLRVVGFTCLFLLFFPIAAMSQGTTSLLRGVFDLSWWGILGVTLLICTIILNLIVITHLILINGGERFELAKSFSEAQGVREAQPNKGLLVLFFLIGSVTIVLTHYASPNAEVDKILPTAAGIICALLLSQFALLFYHWIIPSELETLSPTILEPLRWLRRAPLMDQAQQPKRLQCLYIVLNNILKKLFPRIPACIGRGYFKYQDRKAGIIAHIYPGYVMALIMLTFWTGLYVAIYFLGRQNSQIAAQFPALGYGLIVVMTLCWLSATIVFFLDRYRFPLLLALLLWGWLASWVHFADYYYPVLPQTSNRAVLPGDVVGDRDTIIVVAANGGGIQSAAWTAQVLTGIEQQARQEFGADFREFGNSIRFISGVSGGSLGTMYFVNAYSDKGLPDAALLPGIVDQAAESSLNSVVWGMAYPDLIRVFLPFLPLRSSRGSAAEATWSRSDQKLLNGLSTWSQEVAAGWRPATVFNATIAETGERLLFSTTDFDLVGGKMFQDFGGYDVPIVTAARLSATFPYVLPAARAVPEAPEELSFHVVDGGYYDNYGMVTLTEWLDQALILPDNSIKRVLVLQIRGAPGNNDPQYSFKDNALPDECPALVVAGPRREDASGWLYQASAPFTTMLQVRNTGQVAHNDTELRLLQRTWSQQGVQIESVTFQYSGVDAPLSWHLTQRQREDIPRHWQAYLDNCFPKNKGAWEKVKAFLAQMQ